MSKHLGAKLESAIDALIGIVEAYDWDPEEDRVTIDDLRNRKESMVKSWKEVQRLELPRDGDPAMIIPILEAGGTKWSSGRRFRVTVEEEKAPLFDNIQEEIRRFVSTCGRQPTCILMDRATMGEIECFAPGWLARSKHLMMFGLPVEVILADGSGWRLVCCTKEEGSDAKASDRRR